MGGVRCSVNCRAQDRTSDRRSSTCENSLEERALSGDTWPVAGTMLPTGTNTGRLASFARLNRIVSLKLRSVMLGCDTLSEPVASTVYSQPRSMELQDRFMRHARGLP